MIKIDNLHKRFGKVQVLDGISLEINGGGIFAILGPNGSGKSNVAESIRFVLGEQSIKSLRGKRGEDLIWNGSGNTPRSNRASVTITFDNTKKEFDIDKKIFDYISKISNGDARSAINDLFTLLGSPKNIIYKRVIYRAVCGMNLHQFLLRE